MEAMGLIPNCIRQLHSRETVTVHTMANHSADQPWSSTVMEPKRIPIVAGDFKWAYAVMFTGNL